MARIQCEFCDELSGEPNNRFAIQYRGILNNRVIYKNSRFIVIPTLGQLIKGSLLVLPRKHIERFSDLTEFDRETAQALVGRVKNFEKSPHGHLIYEHGAKLWHGGGCGIYHGHIHVIPLPSPIDFETFLGLKSSEPCADLVTGWNRAVNSSEYLVAGWYPGHSQFQEQPKFQINVENSNTKLVPSQYLRRRITEYFGLEIPWDWREYKDREFSLESVVAKAKVEF